MTLKTQLFLKFMENCEKVKISREQQYLGPKFLVDCKGQRRMARLVQDEGKATVIQVTTRYNRGMQKTISDRTTN